MQGPKLVMALSKSLAEEFLSVNTCCEKKQDAIDLAYESIGKIKAYTDSNLENEENSLIFFQN